MALTFRTNGSSAPNLVGAAWWNDYYNLLTGAMQDQEVTIQNNLVLKALGTAPSSAPAPSIASGAGLGIGLYNYVYSYQSADGESLPSTVGAATTTSGNQKMSVGSIAVGPTGTTGRYLYRTAVGGGTNYKLVTTIADNVTTSYIDTTADASLGTQVTKTSPTFGGALIIKDSTGVVKFTIASDGSLIGSTGGTSFGNTTITGTLSVSGAVTMSSTLSVGLVTFNNGATFAGGDIALNAHGITSAGLIVVTTLQSNTLQDSGGNAYISMTAGSVTRLQTVNTGTIALQTAGSTQFSVTNAAISAFQPFACTSSVTASSYVLTGSSNYAGYTGSFSRISWPTGTGSVTVNHLLGASPTGVMVTCNNSTGSQTQACNSFTSTQISVTSGASLTWLALCWRN